MFKDIKQPTSYIIANPLKQSHFTFREYQNWNLVSPKFTTKDYKEYCTSYIERLSKFLDQNKENEIVTSEEASRNNTTNDTN